MDCKKLLFKIILLWGITTLASSLDAKAAIDPNLHVWPSYSKICTDESFVVYIDASEVGVDYELFDITSGTPISASDKVPGNGRRIQIAPSTVFTEGTYIFQVTATKLPEQANLTETVSITVSTPPNLGLTVDADDYDICANEEVIITLHNSENNVKYYLTDGSFESDLVDGNGNDIEFAPVIPENNTTYVVKAKSENCALEKNIVDDAVINFHKQPDNTIAIEATPGRICPGEDVSISIESSETGVTYQLNDGTSDIPPAQNGTGFAITFATVNPLTTTMYRVLALGEHCESSIELNTRKIVLVNPAPDNTMSFSADPETVCLGESTKLTLASSEENIDYQLYKDGVKEGPVIPGDGNPIVFPEQFPNALTVYSVKAQSPDCAGETDITATATVTYFDLPNKNMAVTPTPAIICEGETINISIESSESNVSYQLINGDTGEEIGSPLDGNNGTINIADAPSKDITYQVRATRKGCSTAVLLDDDAFVQVTPKPDLNLNLSITPSEICEGETAVVSLEGSITGESYQLKEDGLDIGPAQTGNGNTLNFPIGTPVAKNHTYTMEVTGADCNGPSPLTKTANLTVHPKPDLSLTIAIVPLEICVGEDAELTISNAKMGLDYELLDIDNNSIAIQSGNDEDLKFSISPTKGQTYTVKVLSTGCFASQELDTHPSITVNPGPNLDLEVNIDKNRLCNGKNEEAIISVENPQNGLDYTLNDGTSDIETLNSTGVTLNFNKVAPTNTTTYTIYTTITGACHGKVPLNNQALITVIPEPADNIAVNVTNPQLCRGESTQISIQSSETGVSYQLNDGSNDIGTPIAGTGDPIYFPELTPILSSTYIVKATNDECKTMVPLQQTIPLDIGIPPETLLHPTVDKDRICEGEEIIISLTPTDATATYQLFENNNLLGAALPGNGKDLNFPPHTPTQNTIYKIEALGEKCISSVQIPFSEEVEVHHPPLTNLTLRLDHPRICIGEEVNVSLEKSQDGIFYELFDGSQFIEAPVVGNGNTIHFPHLHPNTNTTYTIFAHEAVCTQKQELINPIQVEVLDPNPLPIEAICTPSEICAGQNIQIELPTTINGMEYSLSQKKKSLGIIQTGDGNPLQFPEQTPTESTTYQVMLNSCVEPTEACSLPITVHPTPELEITTQQVTDGYNGSLVVGVNQGTPPFEYNVTPLDIITTDRSLLEFNNLKTGKYLVSVRDGNGCLTADEPTLVEITVSDEEKVVVNNTITPNGDGINDAWIIHLHSEVQNPEVFIYNIYGQEIFHSSHYENDWKGTYNGSSLPNGAYYYLIKFKEADMKPMKGTISILGKY
jgi:gliding motility-associated-like protein